jgi:AP-1 complex subunit mu
MPCSAVYFINEKGKVLISRQYRGDVPANAAVRFFARVIDVAADDDDEKGGGTSPVLEEEGVTYAYVKHANIYILAIADSNSPILMILKYLYQIVEVFTEYFQDLQEESLRDNFVIVYELLDEMMDFGYPQSTDPKVLKQYITQAGLWKKKSDSTAGTVVPGAVTGAVNWRPEGIVYKKNEVYLDVVESVNLLISSTGSVLRSEVVGSVKMNTKLSGMPELRLGFNDRVSFSRALGGSMATGNQVGRQASQLGGRSRSIEVDDVTFHQCVKLSSFEANKVISFIPPDGEFELMSYRLSAQVKPLIWVEALVEKHSHSRIEFLVKAKTQFKARSVANDVVILIPVPPNADSPKFKTSLGSAEYKPAHNVVSWKIKQIEGGREVRLRAHFNLPTIEDEGEKDRKEPIRVSFQIPYFTVSGVQVRHLKVVERSGIDALTWIRYLSEAGQYEIRLGK